MRRAGCEDVRRTMSPDSTCAACGVEPKLRTCDRCGVSAMITDCGHRSQPRPIAAAGVDMLCDACAEAGGAS
jgi:hypothetical protein